MTLMKKLLAAALALATLGGVPALTAPAQAQSYRSDRDRDWRDHDRRDYRRNDHRDWRRDDRRGWDRRDRYDNRRNWGRNNNRYGYRDQRRCWTDWRWERGRRVPVRFCR